MLKNGVICADRSVLERGAKQVVATNERVELDLGADVPASNRGSN